MGPHPAVLGAIVYFHDGRNAPIPATLGETRARQAESIPRGPWKVGV